MKSATTLGRPEATNVLITGASDIKGITTSEALAKRLTLLEADGIALRKGPFAVIEFDAPASYGPRPTFRTDPGFTGTGFTKGGAREWLIDNLSLSDLRNVAIRIIK